jgi:hypothetical protein
MRNEMEKGTAPDCWEKTWLETQDDYILTEDECAFTVCAMSPDHVSFSLWLLASDDMILS